MQETQRCPGTYLADCRGPHFHPARSCPVAGLIQTRWGSQDSKRMAACSTRDVNLPGCPASDLDWWPIRQLLSIQSKPHMSRMHQSSVT